jgi:putative ABC transport system permease protein
MDADVIDAVRDVPGVAEVALEVTGYAQVVGNDGTVVGDQEQAPALGFNWISVPELNPFRIADGRPPTGDDEVVIDRAAADAGGLAVGDVVTVLTREEPTDFTIAGIATFGTADSPAGATAVLFTDAAAQGYLSSPGMVDGVLVHAADGVSQTELVERLDAVLPDVDVVTGADVVADDQAAVAESFGPFKVFLLVFAFIAVFVGAFMINNTFSITVAQRTQQLAMLRALGASRRQVLRTVLAEAFAVGVVGSLAGLVAGIAVAAGLKQLFTAVGVALPGGPMVIAPPAMIVSAVVGISVTRFSAWLPARRAGKVPPIAALRELSVDRSGASVRRTVIGVAVAGLGVLSLLAGLGGAGIVLVGVGAVLTLIGVAVLGPVLARPVSSVFGVVVGRRGIAGDIAVRNAQRNPKRTARTASSLMIGVAMVVFISVLASSVKTSIGGSLQDTFTGTHIVDSGAYDGGGGFSPELADEMVADPSVSVVAESRIGSALVDGSTTRLSGFTGSTIGSVFDLGSVDGDMSGLGPNGIAADAEYAAGHGWEIGSTVDVTMASGIDSFVVEATYDNGSEWVGDYFVDIAAFDAHQPDLLDYRIYAVGDDDAVRSMAADYPSTTVLDADEFLGQVTGDIDMMLGVVYALLALAVIIALLGITNTLALSIFERTRELGLLRAVGMVRAQVRTAIRWEAIMIALFGTALGIGVGSFFGWAGVQALHSEGIEHFTYPAVSVAVVALTAALAGAFAAIAPARRAARLDVLTALSAE